eukprot:s32_g52.t1
MENEWRLGETFRLIFRLIFLPWRSWTCHELSKILQEPKSGLQRREIDSELNPCAFGRRCKRQGCFYDHPDGRLIDDDPTKGMCKAVSIGLLSLSGLCSGSVKCAAVVLSPRNAEKAQRLRDEFPEVVRVANSNQEVVDSCDCIVVAVLPSQVSVLSQLNFKKDVEVVSLMAGLYPQQLRELCGDIPISVVIPYPSIARREGAALLLKPSPVALAMFESLGRCVAVEDEEKFRSYGVDRNISAAWTGASFAAFAADSADAKEDTFRQLLEEQTPGGLNEKVWQMLDEDGSNRALRFALTSVHGRLCHGRFDPQLTPAQQREIREQKLITAAPLALLVALLRWPWRRKSVVPVQREGCPNLGKTVGISRAAEL